MITYFYRKNPNVYLAISEGNSTYKSPISGTYYKATLTDEQYEEIRHIVTRYGIERALPYLISYFNEIGVEQVCQAN